MPIRGRGLRTRRRGRSCNLSKLSQKHIGSAPTPASPHSSGAGSTVRLLTSIGQTVTTNGQQVTVPGLASAQSLVQEHTFRQSIVVLEPITTQSTAVQEPVRRQSTTVQKSGRRQSAAVSQPDGVQEPPSRQPVGVQEPPSRQPATVQEPAVGQSARVQRPAGRQSAAAVRQSVGVHEPPSRQPAGVQEPSSRQLATVQEPAVRQPARVQWRAGRQSAAAVRQPASVQQPAGRQTVAFRQPTSIHPAGRESAAVQEPASSQATSVQDQSAPIPGSDYAQSSPASISANHGNGNLNLVPSTGDTNATTVKKLVISVEAVCHPRRFVPSCVTREITPEILTRMPIPAGKWKEYPVEVKDVLFNEFKEKYKFATPYDNSMARTVWNRTCADRYPDLLAKARETAFKRISSNNIANLKGHGPRGMRREVWDGLVDIWVSKEWQKKSQAGRSNRASIPDSMLHTGGSSFGEHKRKMEAELKRPVTYRDTYDRVHKRKNGEYVSERSKKVVESYDAIVAEKYGQDSSTHPMVDENVWIDVVGSNKKRRVHGLGHSLEIGSPSKSYEVDGPSRSMPIEDAQLVEIAIFALSVFVQTVVVPLLSSILGFQDGLGTLDGASQNHGVGEENEADSDDDSDLE